MGSTPDKSHDDQRLDVEAVREVEAAVTRLADRFAQRDPKIAAALQREARILEDLLAGRAPPSGAAHGSLHRLRELYDSFLVSGMVEESKDASLLILLNRLLGV